MCIFNAVQVFHLPLNFSEISLQYSYLFMSSPVPFLCGILILQRSTCHVLFMGFFLHFAPQEMLGLWRINLMHACMHRCDSLLVVVVDGMPWSMLSPGHEVVAAAELDLLQGIPPELPPYPHLSGTPLHLLYLFDLCPPLHPMKHSIFIFSLFSFGLK